MNATEKQRGNSKGATSAIVAQNVRARRQSLGLDLAQLSARLQVNGWPIPVAALSRLENGQRRIDVDDLVALAVSLETTPNALLFPKEQDSSETGTGVPSWVRGDEVMEFWAGQGLPLRPDVFRKVWASKIGNLREQLHLAQRNYDAARLAHEQDAHTLLTQFELAEARELVEHWTQEINKIAEREAYLRSIQDD